MSVNWFLMSDGKIEGPLTTEQVETSVQHPSQPDCFVWWRGHKGWVRPERWAEVREEVERQALTVKTKTWKIRYEDMVEHGPFNEEELVAELRKNADFSRIEIWTEGLLQWEPVYNVHQFMDSLGVCRRKHPRVDIKAQVHVNEGNTDYIGYATTISEGGLGLVGLTHLETGMKISLVLKSRQISIPIRATANVVYVSPSNGNAGLCFDYISQECKAAIIEFVRKEADNIEPVAA